MSKLHFGCFNCPREGWVNTDVTPHLRIARVPGLARVLRALGKMSDERFAEHRSGLFRRVNYLNVARQWPYAADSFDAIYSSHVLEHLPLRGARVCVREAFRCLRPGGVLRISVPDLDAQIADYRSESAEEWAINFFEANETSEKNMHHFMYNFITLGELMRKSGFSTIARRNYKEGVCPDLDLMDNRPASLFVGAIKA